MNIDWSSVQDRVNDPRLTLIPTAQFVYADQLIQRFPQGKIYVCDAYVKDIETTAEMVVGGFQTGRLINIDHHAPVEAMTKKISSTPLAIERVAAYGPAQAEDAVVINHTDCDSVLSAAIMLGILPPDDEFGRAAVAADHTGESNEIADLLQPAAKFKNFSLSLRNLVKLKTDQPLDPHVKQAMQEQVEDRAKAKKLVEQGKFIQLPGGVAWALITSRMDGALFPSLLPEAKVIVQANPIKDTDKFRMAIRLGQAAPDGSTLHQLNIQEIDPAFGGRWNAGNNSRAGGTSIKPEEYVQQLDQRVSQIF